MAEFCVATGMSPSEYKALTIDEVNAFGVVYERMNKR